TTSISILKQILTCDSKDIKARKEIVDCYKAKYENHSHLEEYIRLSNLNQNWRNVHDAIQDFEKHIAFDKGNFVYHRSWGIGRIRSTKDDEIIVDFAQKKNHKMSLKMAVSSFQVLDKNHIWVYRITKKKEVLNKKVKTDSLWALKTIIRSFDNAADLKKIKAELVPGILSINEWPSWSLKARDLLKTGEAFGNLPDNPDIYTVRDQPMSLEERTYNRFKAEKDFFDRIKTIQEFLEFIGDNGESLENDLFLDMFDYFVTYVRNPGSYNEYTISAMLIISRIVNQFPFLNPGVNLNFKEYFTNLEDYEEMFQKINNTDVRKLFLTYIHKHKIPDWDKIYITLIPYYLHKEVVRELINAKHQDTVIQKFLELYNNYRDMREPYIWFVKNCIHDDWFAKTGIEREKILISMIHLLDITARDIDNKRDVILNRKLHKQVFNFLVKDNTLFDYIRMSSEEIVGRIYSLLEDVKDMDAKVMKMIQKTISERFPNFKFFSNQADVLETTTRSGFLSIMKSYEGRQKALKRLHDVEVPKNSKEIAAAREYGDLKENAEYKAAKERQDILNTTARKWEEELQSVQIIQPDSIHCDKVGFGTMIVLLNLITNTEETVTIMGPWESNPEKKILSHLSPFASKLLNNTVGQVIEFAINKREYRYEIKNILPVNFDEIEPMPVSI
ncbi:MAG: GreA/GreB family elongation factor, partial [Salinispira sp.]